MRAQKSRYQTESEHVHPYQLTKPERLKGFHSQQIFSPHWHPHKQSRPVSKVD